MSTQTTFDGLLTPRQQNDLVDAFTKAERAMRTLGGLKEMGLDVPESDAICLNLAEMLPEGKAFLNLSSSFATGGGLSRSCVIYSRGGVGARFSAKLEYDVDSMSKRLTDWDDLSDCTVLDAADTALDLTEDDLPHIKAAKALGGDWIAVKEFLEGVLDSGWPMDWRPAVRANGSYYTTTMEFENQIYRPSGEILNLRYAMSATEGNPSWEHEQIIAAKLKTFSGMADAAPTLASPDHDSTQ
jgi:hypothetical protein